MSKAKHHKASESYANTKLIFLLLFVSAETLFFIGFLSSLSSIITFLGISLGAYFLLQNLIKYQLFRQYQFFYKKQNKRLQQWQQEENTFYNTKIPYDINKNNTFAYFQTPIDIKSDMGFYPNAILFCEANTTNKKAKLTYRWVHAKYQKTIGTENTINLRSISVKPGDKIECHVTVTSPKGTT